MISYYPLEPDVPLPPPPPQSLSTSSNSTDNFFNNFFDDEKTECNYLVFIFIVSVLFIALTDVMRK